MSWIRAAKFNILETLFGTILKSGPIPKHLAIIMDGNRRYAKSKNMQQTVGHESGFEKLTEVLTWSIFMNIKEISVYAFSLQNFNRPEEEKNYLINMAKKKFRRLIEEKEDIKKAGIRIRILGALTTLPTDLQQLCAKVVDVTQNNNKYVLNIFVAYTSTEEMNTASSEICAAIKDGKLNDSDVDEDLIDKCLYTSQSTEVDLMIRTSGEVRFSDFLLWQSATASISFVKSFWPKFSIWDFYTSIMEYQLNYKRIKELRTNMKKTNEERAGDDELRNMRIKKFLDNLYEKRTDYINNLLEAYNTTHENDEI